MSNPQSLHEIVKRRFEAELGQPEKAMDHEWRWALRRSPMSNTINVMVNDERGRLSAWIFDPHETSREVESRDITSITEAEAVLSDLRQRLQWPDSNQAD